MQICDIDHVIFAQTLDCLAFIEIKYVLWINEDMIIRFVELKQLKCYCQIKKGQTKY